MRKTASVLLAGLLGACANSVTPTTITQDFFNAVAAGTVATCHYLPDFDAVTNLFVSLGYVQIVKTFVDDICAGAIANNPVAAAGRISARRLSVQQSTFTVIVNGQPVVITGHYVN
jgi:hypothetical protein